MMREFCHLKKVDADGTRKRLYDTVSKLFQYALQEEKKSVKFILRQYLALQSTNEGIYM